jgi:hypothetical protein
LAVTLPPGADLLAPSAPRRQRGEDGVQPLYDGRLATDHLAITALEAPDATRRTDVDVVDPALGERLRPANVVVIVRVATVDDGIVGFEQGREFVKGGVDDGRRHHDPDRARLLELGDQVGDRSGRRRASLRQVERRLWMNIEDHALLAGAEAATNHVGPHPSESDHSEFHLLLLEPAP